MARKRKDIRDRTVPWMHLMYCIASTLMQSIVILPSAEKVVSSPHFMTFNPYTASREYYLTSLRIGHFWSQMTTVSEYVEIIRRIEQSAHHNSVCELPRVGTKSAGHIVDGQTKMESFG